MTLCHKASGAGSACGDAAATFAVVGETGSGVVEVTKDMAYHMSWLFNARMQAVRKTLNNEALYNPDVVESAKKFLAAASVRGRELIVEACKKNRKEE